MDFNLPPELAAHLCELDRFIESDIKPLQAREDNERFFDHRREWASTDYERGGLPRHECEDLQGQVCRMSDTADHLRFALPGEFGCKDDNNLAMAVIQEHFAEKGLSNEVQKNKHEA
ncbi:hypothetical protein [Hydrogenophaga sp. SL48]|uniref:hypothetical protein n=1 Tax=Hydrogenophaga sp. SL48 TaxID=2806347 RepID=UPI001F2CE62E|nr:hypothetical protein [Hydrogenophaga sp. SL48]UJW83066.1 hypothetical protein IM738_10555 [Hydrogenophaga sp. SL48]